MHKYHAFKDIPELAAELKAARERFRDSLEPQGDIEMVIEQEGDVRRAMLRVGAGDAAGLFGLKGYVHSQLSERLFKKGGAYYQRLLQEAPELLATNVNHWLTAEPKRRRLLRFDGLDVRAFLSDRFRIIDNLDILTTAVQVITGRDGENGEEKPFARGARCFNWALSDRRMNVCLVNPSMVVDLKNPDRGVMKGVWDESALRAGAHAWLTPAPEHGGDDGGHYVCPSARLKNSETGHGGCNVNPGLLESGCVNMAWLEVNLAQVHVGRVLQEDDLMSDDTRRKENALIFAKVADAVRAVFDPELLLKNVRKFAGLADELVDRKEAINRIAKLPGITEEIRDDILTAYAPMGSSDTLLDVQRAVTNAAHAVRQRDEEQALELEELGGRILERGMAALTA